MIALCVLERVYTILPVLACLLLAFGYVIALVLLCVKSCSESQDAQERRNYGRCKQVLELAGVTALFSAIALFTLLFWPALLLGLLGYVVFTCFKYYRGVPVVDDANPQEAVV